MRHHVSGKKLDRVTHHRRALFKNLIIALITHGRITTSLAKAKAVQGQIDKLITKAKRGTLHHRRQIATVLNQTAVVNRLVDQLAPLTKRSSGYTRIVRLGRRSGDATLQVKLEFVDPVIPTSQDVKSQPAFKSAPTKTKTTAKPAQSTRKPVAKPKPTKAKSATKPAKRIPKVKPTSSSSKVAK